MPAFKDLTGKRFGRLIVLSVNYKAKFPNQKTTYNCKCDCGKESITSAQNLIKGHTKSCGCLRRESMRKTQFAEQQKLKNGAVVTGTI